MTRKDIENYETDKIKTLDDFVAFCCYNDTDFAYEWKSEVWSDEKKCLVYPEKKPLYLWIPFDKLDILTSQVLGNSYFEDGHYPDVKMYDGGVLIDDQDEIEHMLQWCELYTDEEIHAVFPDFEVTHSYPDLSSEESIDAYFKHLEEIGKRDASSNEFEIDDDE